ncbi:hypothetical protein PMZ80_008607 [Knufia obscura]|uniref:Uncharacterized protein n=2 Tax=Knufia TaxID=430999 RepID=A0AAN8EU14_9EURO|nr:hypothetical protein PMZ80_008607 [Knufia obscura]KAK5952063.1 hypothetical protein OHC33_006950 [Knufia fluminis]
MSASQARTRPPASQVSDEVTNLARAMHDISMDDANSSGERTPYASDDDTPEEEQAIPNSPESFPRRWLIENDEYRRVAIDADNNLGEYLRTIDEHGDPYKVQRRDEPHQTALDTFGTRPWTIYDAWRGDLTQTVYLHLKYRVVYDRLPLLEVAEELRSRHGVDIKWLALVQIGRDLINCSAEHHGLDLLYKGPSRTSQELVARIHVHQVKSTVWDALCWRYESTENMQKVSQEREEYESIFGAGAWIGDNKLEEFFQPFVEEEELTKFAHARPFYRDIFAPQFELSNMMSGMELDS